MKTLYRLIALACLLIASNVPAQAQFQTNPGCYTTTRSATGRAVLFQSGRNVMQFSGDYYTTGTPTGVSISIETANFLPATATPFTKIAALTNTTSAQFTQATGGEQYWVVNVATLSGGSSPTIVLNYCLRPITESTTSTQVANSSVTGTGAMVLATSPTLVTPVLGVATGTSIELGAASPVILEGATPDGNETTLAVTDPTADRTVTFADGGGTVMLSSLATNATDAANAVTGASNALVFEGATADGSEVTLTVTDPTADQTITIPNTASGALTVGSVVVPWRDEVTGNATDRVFFIATRGWIVDSCSQVHSVAAGGASTMQLVKDTGTTAPGAGTDLLTAAFDLNATANTVQAKTSGDFVSLAARTLAAGDRLSVDYANAIQSTAGNAVTCLLIPN